MPRRLCLVTALCVAATYFAMRLYLSCLTEFPWDFAINWTAALALRGQHSLYDMPSLHRLGQASIGTAMQFTFTSAYNSYIGPPTTALLYLAFTAFNFPVALAVYRCAIALAFLSAMMLTGFTLAPEDRARGWLAGSFALFLFDPVHLSLWIGQIDAWVMLALAFSIWAYRQERWYLAGVGAGIAALLKISPVVLIVYFLLRGRFRAVLAAGLTMVVLLELALLVGGSQNILIFVHSVAPTLSYGSLHTQNQSFPAWLARLSTDSTDLNSFVIGIGAYRLLSPVIAAFAVAVILYANRQQSEHRLTLPLLIIVALLMGPITWDHYTSWAIITLMSFADTSLWRTCSAPTRRGLQTMILLGACLLAAPIAYVTPEAIDAFAWLRLITGVKTVGLLIWLGVGYWLIQRPFPPHTMPSARGAA